MREKLEYFKSGFLPSAPCVSLQLDWGWGRGSSGHTGGTHGTEKLLLTLGHNDTPHPVLRQKPRFNLLWHQPPGHFVRTHLWDSFKVPDDFFKGNLDLGAGEAGWNGEQGRREAERLDEGQATQPLSQQLDG